LLPLADAPLVPPAQPLLRRRPPVAVRIREKVQVVHELPRTISPGGLPVNRSASSAACSSTAAAAWSTTLRAARPRTPPARRPLSAVTVVSLSSYNRTVPSGRRPASRTANLRAASAAGPSRPDSDVGSPTTTSIASCSATSTTSRATSPFPLLTVSRGDARTPPGSQRATPIRTLPTSTPNRTPCLMASLRSAAQDAPAVPASLVARSLLRRSARSSVHPAPRPSQASWLRSAQRLRTHLRCRLPSSRAHSSVAPHAPQSTRHRAPRRPHGFAPLSGSARPGRLTPRSSTPLCGDHAAPTAYSTALRASPIAAGFEPPPWARSSLPPPPPPRALAAIPTSAPAFRPRSRAPSVTA